MNMKLTTLLLTLALPLSMAAQTPAQAPTANPAPAATPAQDPWQAVSFLQGTWAAKTGEGSAAKVAGNYAFQKVLKGHIMTRVATVSDCTGPEAFDCQHSDLFYIFQDAPGQSLKAIYFDNEGHVIHYGVSTPGATTVVFLSEDAPGPRFRLTYHLDGTVMSGKFQMQLPGQDKWNSYLEWSGGKQ